MAVVLRLQRIGKRTQPHYRIVAIEKSTGPHGQPLEVVGHYNPKAEKDKEKIVINADKLARWVKNGAKPSDTVGSLITRANKVAKAALAAAAAAVK
ncbi:MAG TPA: 30S ribosomal protein S16 [Elusimicrobiales bacterium]|nr:30S ribosomal protein S16 [Elusimicrobiales bacterium]